MQSLEKFVRPQIVPGLAPLAIGLGLAVLAAAMLWRLPPIAGMALVVLGATAATVERYHRTPLLRPMIVAHSAVYGALYALFVAAILHPTAQVRIGLIEAVDATASLALLAASALLVVHAWQRSGATG